MLSGEAAGRGACARACSTSSSRHATLSARRRVQTTRTVRAAAAASETAQQLKLQLASELSGLDRGIFGVPAAKKAAVGELLGQLEVQTPVAAPIEHLGLVAGDWRLLYSTIRITGVKRTRLGLREFVKLGDFVQSIDTEKALATNTVQFSVSGLGMLRGSLTIRAAYRPVSGTRVDIDFLESTLVPEQLNKIFEDNYDMLLSIFNPQGHLDVTYLDDTHRVGRDDKGNVFYLERV